LNKCISEKVTLVNDIYHLILHLLHVCPFPGV